MNQLSMESRIGLRKLGASSLSYVLDKVLNKTDGSVEITVAEICNLTNLSRRVVEKALNVEALRNSYALLQQSRDLQNRHTDLLHQIDLILGIVYKYKVKTVQKVGHKQPALFRLPSSEEVDEVFAVQYPTYVSIRLDTYPQYKADITQFLTVVQPGRHSYAEIARATGVSDSTVKRHEKIANTTVVRHYASVPVARWGVDTLPEDYQDYMENTKKYKFRGAWLEYKGIKEPYAKTGYQKHLLRGGTKETIEVKWNKRGDHFARADLVIERPIDEHEINMYSLWTDAVVQGKKTFEEYAERFPDLFRWKKAPAWQEELIAPPQMAEGD